MRPEPTSCAKRPHPDNPGVYCAAFAPDSTVLAFGSKNDGVLRLWDVTRPGER